MKFSNCNFDKFLLNVFLRICSENKWFYQYKFKVFVIEYYEKHWNYEEYFGNFCIVHMYILPARRISIANVFHIKFPNRILFLKKLKTIFRNCSKRIQKKNKNHPFCNCQDIDHNFLFYQNTKPNYITILAKKNQRNGY